MYVKFSLPIPMIASQNPNSLRVLSLSSVQWCVKITSAILFLGHSLSNKVYLVIYMEEFMEQWPGSIQDRSSWFPVGDSTATWHWRV